VGIDIGDGLNAACINCAECVDTCSEMMGRRQNEQGLLWDKEQHDRMNSGLNVEILNKTFRVGENELLIRLLDRDRRPVKAGDVSVLVSRPSTTTCDRRYNAMSSPDNLYRSSVRLPLYGHWDVKVQIAQGQKTVTFESKIFAEK
jgi:nitrogen fixation protein FixH